MNPVVVTGIGIVTALGSSREQTWANLLAGQSGIHPSGHGLEAKIVDFVPDGAHSKAGDLALMAAEEALRHAGWNLNDVKGEKIGVAISQSKPIINVGIKYPSKRKSPSPKGRGQGWGSNAHFGLFPNPVPSPDGEGDRTLNGINPLLLLSSFTGWSSESVVKNAHRLTGPSSNIVAACATGTAALSEAAYWIRSGRCRQALAGAVESSLQHFYRSGFRKMGVLVDGTDVSAVRPFDRDRSGFAMGEGAAVLHLESLDSAHERGVDPLAILDQVVLGHSGTDGIHFDAEGRSISNLVTAISSRTPPRYINAHGTATRINDAAEAKGIRSALEKKLGDVFVSSTKAGTGHLLGAAGAVEAAFCVLAIRDQMIPPTLHLENPDPDFELNIVAGKPVRAEIDSAASLSYGFGGQMGAVRFKRDVD